MRGIVDRTTALGFAGLLFMAFMPLILLSCESSVLPVPAPISYSAEKDPWGNRYPVECRDLADMVAEVPVTFLSEEDMLFFFEAPTAGKNLLGEWTSPNTAFGRGTKYGHIFLNSTRLRDSLGLQIEAQRHELCHAKMFKLHGTGWWHH